jgi:hypothetical protein
MSLTTIDGCTLLCALLLPAASSQADYKRDLGP